MCMRIGGEGAALLTLAGSTEGACAPGAGAGAGAGEPAPQSSAFLDTAAAGAILGASPLGTFPHNLPLPGLRTLSPRHHHLSTCSALHLPSVSSIHSIQDPAATPGAAVLGTLASLPGAGSASESGAATCTSVCRSAGGRAEGSCVRGRRLQGGKGAPAAGAGAPSLQAGSTSSRRPSTVVRQGLQALLVGTTTSTGEPPGA